MRVVWQALDSFQCWCPTNPTSEANRAAWEALKTLDTPFLTVFGEDDRVMAGVDKLFQKLIPGAVGHNHIVVPRAGHFIQEYAGAELAQAILKFIEQT